MRPPVAQPSPAAGSRGVSPREPVLAARRGQNPQARTPALPRVPECQRVVSSAPTERFEQSLGRKRPKPTLQHSNDSSLKKGLGLAACALLGAVLAGAGWLVPAHLRVVDADVLELAGRGSASLVSQGLALANERKVGPARLLLEAAHKQRVPDADRLGVAIAKQAAAIPGLDSWGGPVPRWGGLVVTSEAGAKPGSPDLAGLAMRLENRGPLLDFLRSSPKPLIQELLRCRGLTNTVLLPPSGSASGQVFDAALTVCGLLIEDGHLTRSLTDGILVLSASANGGGDSQRLEQVLLDFLSLGQRFNWGELQEFAARINDAETLRLLAELVRKAGGQMPELLSAVELSREPADAARYLMNFSQTGMKDVARSLAFGSGGLNLLLQRNQPLFESGVRPRSFHPLGVALCWSLPWAALTAKWLLYLGGGLFLAAALQLAGPTAPEPDGTPRFRGLGLARLILFALGFLVVVLLLSEPFLAQESRKVEMPFRLRLPLGGSAVAAGVPSLPKPLMNFNLLTLALFFVLQASIYVACLMKLSEIRRQNAPARLKLKLLENEDHLFDAGLYLGFAGTIVSFILVSLGIIKGSLMAAYSSTSFGIIFVSVFKIFHLRPSRRGLLMEAEAQPTRPVESLAKPEPAGPA